MCAPVGRMVPAGPSLRLVPSELAWLVTGPSDCGPRLAWPFSGPQWPAVFAGVSLRWRCPGCDGLVYGRPSAASGALLLKSGDGCPRCVRYPRPAMGTCQRFGLVLLWFKRVALASVISFAAASRCTWKKSAFGQEQGLLQFLYRPSASCLSQWECSLCTYM